MMFSSFNEPPPELFFEYKSEGTYSRLQVQVQIFADHTVHYKKSKFAPVSVVEEWSGTLSEKDYNTFAGEIINNCKFMSLPQKPDEEIMIKDVSYDYFTVNYNSRKHQIGGYGSRYCKSYKCVYQSYNIIIGMVSGIKYIAKPLK
jgi:hypothetical protein